MSKAEENIKLVRNELDFRKKNEQIKKGFRELDRIANGEGQQEHIEKYDGDLHFFCECSNENCQERIWLHQTTYDKIHKNRSQFVIICGHEIKEIEEVVERNNTFCIVKKRKR